MYRAGANPGPMADPPAGPPEASPTNTQETTGRVTTWEVWKLIDEPKDIIHRQTALIESTKAKLQEIKHDQNVLHEQNQKLHEEVKALRAQLESPPAAPLARWWAAVVANTANVNPLPSHHRPDKDRIVSGLAPSGHSWTQRTTIPTRGTISADIYPPIPPTPTSVQPC